MELIKTFLVSHKSTNHLLGMGSKSTWLKLSERLFGRNLFEMRESWAVNCDCLEICLIILIGCLRYFFPVIYWVLVVASNLLEGFSSRLIDNCGLKFHSFDGFGWFIGQLIEIDAKLGFAREVFIPVLNQLTVLILHILKYVKILEITALIFKQS